MSDASAGPSPQTSTRGLITGVGLRRLRRYDFGLLAALVEGAVTGIDLDLGLRGRVHDEFGEGSLLAVGDGGAYLLLDFGEGLGRLATVDADDVIAELRLDGLADHAELLRPHGVL